MVQRVTDDYVSGLVEAGGADASQRKGEALLQRNDVAAIVRATLVLAMQAFSAVKQRA